MQGSVWASSYLPSGVAGHDATVSGNRGPITTLLLHDIATAFFSPLKQSSHIPEHATFAVNSFGGQHTDVALRGTAVCLSSAYGVPYSRRA